MKTEMEIIEICWTGALKYTDIARLTDPEVDYGVYCIYGNHVISGPDTLLYIGKASQQTFAARLIQHGEWLYNDSEDLKFYFGRIGSITASISDDEWSQNISDSERLLIHYLSPPYNSSDIYKHPVSDEKILILNLGKRYRLPYCVTSLYFDSEKNRKSNLWKPYQYLGKGDGIDS